ncbi:hypothetical protein BHE74_00014326 [Ensete ventricosum]|nr:hypothetical protein BHE74_00014326 [Ensete ventricosum]RZR83446.1 hypothetical protein BHM03_00010050 [Ensete ventricosum]
MNTTLRRFYGGARAAGSGSARAAESGRRDSCAAPSAPGPTPPNEGPFLFDCAPQGGEWGTWPDDIGGVHMGRI